MSDATVLALVGLAVAVGGVCGWAASQCWSFMKERRASKRQREADLWSPTDTDWLESHGIGE